MPRRKSALTRDVLPDPKYGSTVVAKFTNQVMLDGKKGLAQELVYGAFDIIEAKMGMDPMEVFNKAMENTMPKMEVKARRVGGATVQVPDDIRPARRQTLAIRWLVLFAKKRGEKTMVERLSAELMDAYNNTGNAVKKKEEMHRMAEANKAFAHYRW